MGSKKTYKNDHQFNDYRIGLGKRLFDIIFSALALIVFSPFLLLIIISIKLTSRGQLLFKSERVGTGYDIFTFYKFRTMYKGADKERVRLSELNEYLISHKKNSVGFINIENCPECELGKPCSPSLFIDGIEICENLYLRKKRERLLETTFFKVKDDPRITTVGKFLRNTNLDEFPQFINVLKGDMSIVGNRPIPLYEADKLTTDEWSYRFLAPAGITGLWQVHKDNKLKAENRIRLDNQYAMVGSPKQDLIIILKTIPALFRIRKALY
ncbi:MAG: sugar transferase [Bacteroidetes bacterium]|nr:sugar transferase [Bacteroidota bacterium]